MFLAQIHNFEVFMFYLCSTELRDPYQPRQCTVLKRLRSELRDDMMLIRIAPSLPIYVYNTQEDISTLLIASRFKGDTLFPITTFPLYVYICNLEIDKLTDDGFVKSDCVHIIDWGKIIQ